MDEEEVFWSFEGEEYGDPTIEFAKIHDDLFDLDVFWGKGEVVGVGLSREDLASLGEAITRILEE